MNNSYELAEYYLFECIKIEKNQEELYEEIDYKTNIETYIKLLEKVDNKNMFYEYNGKQIINNIECFVITIYLKSSTEYVGWELYINSENGFVMKDQYYCNIESNKKPKDPYSEVKYTYIKKGI